MAIIGIVAVDRNGAIGKGGGLPWHYSADMKFFKEQTTGSACVMGYRTWLTLKRPLPGRLNVVLTRRSDAEPRESVVWLRGRQSALALTYRAGAVAATPDSLRSRSALSVASHGASMSLRPKWPYAAVRW